MVNFPRDGHLLYGITAVIKSTCVPHVLNLEVFLMCVSMDYDPVINSLNVCLMLPSVLEIS